MTVTVEAIGSGGDLATVARFLNEELDPDIPPEVWARSFDYPWMPERPNNGFRLMDGPRLVGVLLAFYCERRFGERRIACCNLSSWCVLPDYRAHSFRLMKRILSQTGYDFIDLTATDEVVRISTKLGFKRLDVGRVLVPHLPRLPKRGVGIARPEELPEGALPEPARTIFEDHRGLPGIAHLAARTPAGPCYLIYARRRRKGVPCAVIRHVEPSDRLPACLSSIGGYLLRREGLLASVVEERFLPRRPFGSIRLAKPSRKLYRGPNLRPGDIDNLYSELLLLPMRA